MNCSDFDYGDDQVNDPGDHMNSSSEGNGGDGDDLSFDDHLLNVDEYGEIEDDCGLGDEGESFEDICSEANAPVTQSPSFALHHHQSTSLPHSLSNSWLKRSFLAPNETDKEFQLFNLYCMYGGGRSLQYVSVISNISPSVLNKISKKNNWKRRTEDYDRAELVKKMKQAQTSKHELHIRKLERYRQEQEALGQQLTVNAARIAFIANSTLTKMIEEDRDIDQRDLPSMLNVAAKLADVGKSLQSSSLGVDSLLAALDEGEDA